MSADQPLPDQPAPHQHSRGTCGLPSGDEPPRSVAQVRVHASALGLSVSMFMDPCLPKATLARALEAAAASLRDGSYMVDPMFCGHKPGTCSCKRREPVVSTVTLTLDAQLATITALRTAAHRKAHLIDTLGPGAGQKEFLDDLRLDLEWIRTALLAFEPGIDVDDTVTVQCWSGLETGVGVQMCHKPLTVEWLDAQRAEAGVAGSAEDAWRVVLELAGCSSTTIPLRSTPVYEVCSVIGRAHQATEDRPEDRRRLLLAAAVIEGRPRS